jgi:membrane protein
MGGILVHSLSAYQNEIQANRPIMLKALDVLHAFWETQRKGQPLKEKDLLGNKLSSVRGLDTDTWGDLRDTLMAHKVIVQSDQGHYVLSRDLHSVHLWQLQDWVNGELPLDRPGIAGELSWQESSHRLLLDQRKSTREILNVSLGELFNA